MKFTILFLATIAIFAGTSNAERKRSSGKRLRALSDEQAANLDFPLDSLKSLSLSMNVDTMIAESSPHSNVLHSSKSGKGGKAGLDFDHQAWKEFDIVAKSFDVGYLGNYDASDTTDLSASFPGSGSQSYDFSDGTARVSGAAVIFDLGSSTSLFRLRGAVITLSEIRTIWHELSPTAGHNNGVVMKSVGDSLFIFFEKASDGLTAARSMYLALIARWEKKVELACGSAVNVKEGWCGTVGEDRKRFFNTAAIGVGYGEMLLIPKDGKYIDAFGAPVNNAFFASGEKAGHGEFLIDEDALQSLLEEAGQNPQEDACKSKVVQWTVGELGINRFIVRDFNFGCYYTTCFDDECDSS